MTKHSLPENAYKAFEGKIYNVWQREQEMYDGTTKIFEKVQRPDVATIIALVGDKIVVQKQQQPNRKPFISLPGGRCEQGEDPKISAVRELLEETGLKSDDMTLWRVVPSLYSSVICDIYYYIAKDCKKIQEMNLDNGEKIENELINFDEFIMLSDNPRFRHGDLVNLFLRMRLHSEQREEFRREIFG